MKLGLNCSHDVVKEKKNRDVRYERLILDQIDTNPASTKLKLHTGRIRVLSEYEIDLFCVNDADSTILFFFL